MALPVEGTPVPVSRWYRHTLRGRDPLLRADPPPDNRWQRGAIIGALYLANDQATVWAEWYRLLAEAGIPPNHALPRALWTWEVNPEPRVADLRTKERLDRVGLGMPRPGRDTWAPCQEVGETLWRDGWRGLMAPSAARPTRGVVLVLFRPDDAVPGARPISPPSLVTEPPVPPRGMAT